MQQGKTGPSFFPIALGPTVCSDQVAVLVIPVDAGTGLMWIGYQHKIYT
jgi:hypothetical protein